MNSCKSQIALTYAACFCCGRRPETLEPLPKGWSWDTAEPDVPWLVCPLWINGSEPVEMDFTSPAGAPTTEGRP